MTTGERNGLLNGMRVDFANAMDGYGFVYTSFSEGGCYGLSKQACERLFKLAHKRGKDARKQLLADIAAEVEKSKQPRGKKKAKAT